VSGCEKAGKMLRALFRVVLVVAVLGFVGLAGYAYFGDLSPRTQQQSVTVTLDAD
jgi:cell division protein YceG involved in septum cleavage